MCQLTEVTTILFFVFWGSKIRTQDFRVLNSGYQYKPTHSLKDRTSVFFKAIP